MSPVSGRRVMARVGGRRMPSPAAQEGGPDREQVLGAPDESGAWAAQAREPLDVEPGFRRADDLVRVGCLIQREPVGPERRGPRRELGIPLPPGRARDERRDSLERDGRVARGGSYAEVPPGREELVAERRGGASSAGSEMPGGVTRQVRKAHDVVALRPERGQCRQ